MKMGRSHSLGDSPPGNLVAIPHSRVEPSTVARNIATMPALTGSGNWDQAATTAARLGGI